MITIKKIITIILLLIAPLSALCENRAYKTIGEIKFYDGDEGGKKPMKNSGMLMLMETGVEQNQSPGYSKNFLKAILTLMT